MARWWAAVSVLLTDSEECGVVGVSCVHAGQNGLLVLWPSAVEEGGEAGVGVLSGLPLLAEVESFFELQYLRGVGLLCLRGGPSCFLPGFRRAVGDPFGFFNPLVSQRFKSLRRSSSTTRCNSMFPIEV